MLMQIRINLGVVLGEFFDFEVDDVVDFFFTLLQKLAEDHHNLIKVLHLLEGRSLVVFVQNGIEAGEDFIIIV